MARKSILSIFSLSGDSGGGEPSAYLKSIAVSGQTVTITDKEGNDTSFSLDKLPHGSTLPSGQYEGQIFNYEGTEIRKGIYQYDGNQWSLIAAVGGQDFETYEWETTLTNGDIIYEATIKED